MLPVPSGIWTTTEPGMIVRFRAVCVIVHQSVTFLCLTAEQSYTGGHFFHHAENPTGRYTVLFWGGLGGSRFAHSHARRPFCELCGGGPGYSKSGGAVWLGLVFTNGDGLEHSKATSVLGTLKCTTPPTLSEIRVISFPIKILSTLDAPHVTPEMVF